MFALNALLTGCVTTHFGDPTKTKNGNLLVSCGMDSTLSTDNYETISCTLENKGKSWETVRVHQATPAPDAKVMTPTEVNDYFTSLKFKLAQDRYNTDLALTTVALVGLGAAAVGSANGLDGVAASGMGAAMGAGGYGVGRDIKRAHDGLQYHQELKYGPDHLLDNEFKIPAGLYIRKNILVELTGPKGPVRTLSLCFDERKQECQEIPVRPGVGEFSRLK